MQKAEILLKSIDEFVEKASTQDELKELLKDFPERERLLKSIEGYETVIAKALRKQKRNFVNALKKGSSSSVGNPVARAIVDLFLSEMMDDDEFDLEMAQASVKFLSATVPDLASALMQAIDKDVAFNTLSPRAVEWIDEWSDELGRLMKLSTHERLNQILQDGLEQGLSIDEIQEKIEDLPEFSRNRARKTAITEVLTASSVAQHEAYLQSPAVTGKTWMHSGARAIKPRPHHVALDGTTIPLNQKFDVNGYLADYPRDTSLPASERVYCHCVLVPAVDEDILGLTKEEKEIIRQQKMQELGVI